MIEAEDVDIFVLGLIKMTEENKLRWNGEACNTFCLRMNKGRTGVTLSIDRKQIAIVDRDMDVHGKTWLDLKENTFNDLINAIQQSYTPSEEAKNWVNGFIIKNLKTL